MGANFWEGQNILGTTMLWSVKKGGKGGKHFLGVQTFQGVNFWDQNDSGSKFWRGQKFWESPFFGVKKTFFWGESLGKSKFWGVEFFSRVKIFGEFGKEFLTGFQRDF